MDLISAWMECDLGEVVGHPNPDNQVMGDFLFTKSDTTPIKSFLAQVSKHPFITDEIMGDSGWYSRRNLTLEGLKIVSSSIDSLLDDGTDVTFTVTVNCKMKSADLVKIQDELLSTIEGLTLITYKK